MKYLILRLLRKIYFFFKRLLNAGIPLKFVVILCALVGAFTYLGTHNSKIRDVGGTEDYAEAKRYIEIKDVLDEHFIEPVDRSVMADAAASSMVLGLGDPWSYFMTADEYRAYQLSTANDYADIGLSIVKDEANGGFQVISVYPGSPAANAGVGNGMIITALDGEKLLGYTTDEVRTKIRGKLNTKFVLEIANGQGSIEVDCTNVNAESVNFRMEKTGAAYIQIHNFEAGSGQSAVDAIEYLLGQGADSLVIDVRNNPGGLATETAVLLDYLLPAGRLFSEVDKKGVVSVTESDSMNLQMPTCVLLNSGTYGEAELFAAVMKEWNWATLMGEPTYGNTRSQETIPLSDGSAIRLSTRSFLTPSGVDICATGGVVPDFIVYNSDESATGTTEGTTGGEDGTASISDDDQLMAALRLLS